jgi:subtilisin family serine protease
VQIGVGSERASELVTLKIAEARQNGVACIAAAGGSGRLVQFPAVAPGVLAVSAIGKFGEFPPDSYHAQMALGQPVGADGLFIPKFNGYAPEAAVCAPGVAIVSTVPGGGYAAWDGAAVAAAHVTGFAALLLAHYPLFRGAYVSRGEHRVAALFETIRASGDPSRIGGGLADLQRIPGWAFLAQQPVRDDALLPRSPEAAAAAGCLGALPQHAAPNHLLMQLRAMGIMGMI